jgi:hypothetical protein
VLGFRLDAFTRSPCFGCGDAVAMGYKLHGFAVTAGMLLNVE